MNYYKIKTRLFAIGLPVCILLTLATLFSCNDTANKASTTVITDSISTKAAVTPVTTTTTSTVTKANDSIIVHNRRGMMSTDPTDTSKDRGIKNPGKSKTGVKNPGLE